MKYVETEMAQEWKVLADSGEDARTKPGYVVALALLEIANAINNVARELEAGRKEKGQHQPFPFSPI